MIFVSSETAHLVSYTPWGADVLLQTVCGNHLVSPPQRHSPTRRLGKYTIKV